MRALYIVDHSPDYREPFLRKLGRRVQLTVVAKPCQKGLVAPKTRSNYEYIEIPAWDFAGLYWQPGLLDIVRGQSWDVICCSITLRHLDRQAAFLASHQDWRKWVWRGHVYGRDKSKLGMWCRDYLLHRAAGCLVYNDEIVQRLQQDFGVTAVSFNNTEVEEADFRPGEFRDSPLVHLLFVGRYQKRKRLERLLNLAARREDVRIRLVGPEMDRAVGPAYPDYPRDRVEIFSGQSRGDELAAHFDWADLVASPGHVGLLVMNAARYGKGIVVDTNSQHAPEYLLAVESHQPFISFGNPAEEDAFIDRVVKNRRLLRDWGRELQSLAREKYTIEAMVEAHVRVFERVAAEALVPVLSD